MRKVGPMVVVSVSVHHTKSTVDAQIDTGFDGSLCLPISLAILLGLELAGTIGFMLADGTLKRDYTFWATITLGEESFRKEILITESDITLLGSELLENRVLEIDYGNRTVKIRKSPGQ